MTQDVFEQHLALSRKRLEELWQRADKLPTLSKQLWRQAPEFSREQQKLLKESLQELSNSIEELQVAGEELRQQNEELVASRLAVEAERQRYQNLFECAPYGYLVTTKEGVIREANQMAAQLLNVFQKRLIGKPLVVFVAAEERRSFYQQLSQLQKGESIHNWQLQIQRRRGVGFKAFCTVAPIQDSQGQVVTLSWCIQDVTSLLVGESMPGDQKRTEEQENSSAASVALTKESELSAIKSHFASVVSQELRNPLNTIDCCAKLIEAHSQKWSEEKKGGYLQQIQVNVKQITQRLDDLLLIGKIEAGQQKLNPALIDLTQFCHELVQNLQQGVGQKHKLSLTHQGPHPGVWDAKLLRRILMNLLLNAIKYSPEGSEVKLNVVCLGREVRFSIQDSGIGIPPEERKLVFKSFQRGSNVGIIPGSGLGLAIAKQCVELHRGEISLESQVGIGTTVTVTLPLNLRVKQESGAAYGV